MAKSPGDELAGVGYWGMLIDPRYGGQGAPVQRFTRFLTRVACWDPMTAGLASVHGCIGAVDPVRTFGTAEQKERFLPRLASGERSDSSRTSVSTGRLTGRGPSRGVRGWPWGVGSSRRS